MSTFVIDGFTDVPHTLTIAPAGTCPETRECWAYELYCGNQRVFAGADLGTPSGVSEDEVAAHALVFLTLRPGDTDPEFFAGYTPEQIQWCDCYAEELALCLYDENGSETGDLAAYRVDP